MVSVEFYHRYSFDRHCNDVHEALGGGKERVLSEAEQRQIYYTNNDYDVSRRDVEDGVMLLVKKGKESFLITIKEETLC